MWGSGGLLGVWSNTLPHVHGRVCTVYPITLSLCSSKKGTDAPGHTTLVFKLWYIPCSVPLESIMAWKRLMFNN